VAVGLAHLDEVGLDHEVARGVVGAAVLERSGLVRVARDHRQGDVLAPGALEIEEHDDAVTQTVGGQDGDQRGGLAHGRASALAMMSSQSRFCAGRFWRRCTITVSGRQRPPVSQSRPTKITAGPAIAWPATQSVRSANVVAKARSSSRVPFSTMTTGVSGSAPAASRWQRSSGALPIPMYTANAVLGAASACQSRSGAPSAVAPVTTEKWRTRSRSVTGR